MKRLYLLLWLACIAILPIQAQRLIPKQYGVTLLGGVPLVSQGGLFQKGNGEFTIEGSRYFQGGNYLYVASNFAFQGIPYRSYKIPLFDVLGEVGYRHCVISDKRKNILGYLGASTHLGYEEPNRNRKLLPDGAIIKDRKAFVFGLGASIGCEGFITDHVVWLTRFDSKLMFLSDLHLYRPSLSVGVKYNF